MRFGKAALFLLAFSTLHAQDDTIGARLYHVLSGTGKQEQAAAEFSNRDYVAIDQILAAVPAPDPQSRQELRALRGALAFLSGDMKTSLEHFQEAAVFGPLSDADSFTEAMALVKLGSRTDARKLLESLVRGNPGQPLYIYWLGRIDYDEHRYEDAVQNFQQAIRMNPNLARAWDSLGLAFDMLGRASEAKDSFERAVALNRQQSNPSPWPPHDLGYWLLRANEPQQAETALREALRYDDGLPDAHYHLARVLEKEGRASDAITEYESAVRLNPNAADVCYSLAMLYRKQHRDSEAAAMFAEYKKRREAQQR